MVFFRKVPTHYTLDFDFSKKKIHTHERPVNKYPPQNSNTKQIPNTPKTRSRGTVNHEW